MALSRPNLSFARSARIGCSFSYHATELSIVLQPSATMEHAKALAECQRDACDRSHPPEPFEASAFGVAARGRRRPSLTFIQAPP